jgi:hypothetical protein
MWPFSKKDAPKSTDSNENRGSEDPLLKAKMGANDVFQRLLIAMKDQKGVHVESLLCVLGTLAGYSCQASIRKELIEEKGLSEDKAFVIVECADGSKYYFGDALNKPLAESQYSVWSLSAGAVNHLGAEQLIDINEIFTHVSQTVGSSEFGKLRLPEEHNTGDLPYNYLKALWPVFLPIIQFYCPPSQWPILFGLAIQECIFFAKDVIDPLLALSIVMESAVAMSKVNLKLQTENV